MRPHLTLSLLRTVTVSSTYPAGSTPAERFWRYTDVRGPKECWRWRGEIAENGYGRLGVWPHHYSATHISFLLAGKHLPDGMMLCHTCDTPWCVNPHHLFVGTAADNMQDAAAKGRLPTGDRHPARARPGYLPIGEDHPSSKLTDDIVRSIRLAHADGETFSMIARRIGVDRKTVSLAIKRERWAHVD